MKHCIFLVLNDSLLIYQLKLWCGEPLTKNWSWKSRLMLIICNDGKASCWKEGLSGLLVIQKQELILRGLK